MLNDIEAICFDLDDTLWDLGGVLERAEAQAEALLARRYPRILECYARPRRFEHRMALAREYPQHSHDVTWLRIESMERIGAECGYGAGVGEAVFEVFIAARNDIEPFADVRPSLAELARELPLASLTNGNADLGRIGLAHFFRARLDARLVGAAKPDARAFLAVAAELELPAERIAYVGDDPLNDVAGARAAGLRAIWINRRARSWPGDLTPAELEIGDLQSLCRLLRSRDAM
jgi:putative hydrolase of the HAD superfamily